MTHTLDRLWQTVENRRTADPETSWTAKLLSKGPEKCAEKFGEEAIEALIEAVKGDRDALTREGADVLYHFCIMLASRNVALRDVLDELDRRDGESGLTEKAARPK
ncbi:phosphoribosyl-ATP diphosphatase [Jannaschia donghaensis]|uniref:Phosphoribosyl-ATP pyrophosphatase n=1 Tax=Jannaschia donghaensis TaxID=420998 RepID=A0A0M6YH58_9RHOB|nr:phosphoribosyl-ATP diphosphatase [Jannaschia donghaensis]CTQ48833.1 Phosphoribosyl-ATP pyrophosphatase [Jannaschia donghaensis]